MAQRIDVPGMGVVEFPDGMSDDQIASAIKANMGGTPTPAPTATAPDPYKAAAQQEFDTLKAKGVPVEASYADRLAHGMTLGGSDEILAGLATPVEMIKRGTFNPVEAYKHAKAWQDVRLEDASKRQGALGSVAELGGGLFTGAGLAGQGVTLVPKAAGIARRIAGFGAEGAGYGGVTGFLDGGNSLDERLSGAAQGAGTGALIGAALPAATGAAGAALSPVISNIRARMNPTGAAAGQVMRAVSESGRPIGDVVSDVTAAAREGQPQYSVADALGNAGQRLLSTVSRNPGEGRTQVVNFLENRQAGQGKRVANTLAEGFQAPVTPEQARESMLAARSASADKEYGAVRGGANPVDLTSTIAKIDDTITPGVNQIANPGSNIADDSIESVLRRFRARLTDGKSMQTDFTSIQRTWDDLGDAIGRAARAGENNKVRLLTQVKAELAQAMEAGSSGFRQANANFRARSKVIDALDEGKIAATRGRTEDTIPAFRAMNPQQQEAYRIGYADPLIAQTQGAAVGVNKARPFTSDAFRAESQAVAPLTTGNQMARRLSREQTMFETGAQALGGSKTADNLADNARRVDSPWVIAHLLRGNIGAAASLAVGRAENILHGSTQKVRSEIAKLLLQSGPNPSLQKDLARESISMERRRKIANALLRGAVTGTAFGTAP